MTTIDSSQRLENGPEFAMTSIVGHSIAAVVAYVGPAKPESDVEIVGLRFHGDDRWHRFFLDAGIGFWEVAKKDAFIDFEGSDCIDMSNWPIAGATIVDAGCEPSPLLARMYWKLNTGILYLEYDAEADIDSAIRLRFERANSNAAE